MTKSLEVAGTLPERFLGRNSRYYPRMSRMGAAIGIAVMAATVAVSAACTGQNNTNVTATSDVSSVTTTAPSQQAAALGATLDIATDSGTAAYTVSNLAPVPAEAQIIPAKGTMYAVDVRIRTQSGTTNFNAFNFDARAQDGTRIAPAVGAVNPGITSGELPQGQEVAAHLAFDVPAGKSIAQVFLHDSHGKPLALWSTA
jgi:Domain of unknown function (DUF1942)